MPGNRRRPPNPDAPSAKAAELLQEAWDAAPKEPTLAWRLAGKYHYAIVSRLRNLRSVRHLRLTQATGWLNEFLALEQHCDARRLGVGKVADRLLRRRAQDKGIAFEHMARGRGVGLLREEAARAEEVLEHLAQSAAVAALFQRKELVEPAGRLRQPQALDAPQVLQAGNDGVMVLPRQPPRERMLLAGVVPRLLQQLRGTGGRAAGGWLSVRHLSGGPRRTLRQCSS